MKKLTLSIVLFVALIGLAPVGFVSCKNPNATAFKTVGTVQISADAAMRVWGDYVAANHPGPVTEQKVKDAFLKYRAAMLVLADAGAALSVVEKASLDPTNARTRLDIALAAAASSLGDLTNLIRSFGAKI